MLGFSEIISFYMDFEIRRKTDFDFCIKLKDFMHLFNIYWVLFSKQKCGFLGNFAIFCIFSRLFLIQFFDVKHCPHYRTRQKVTGKIAVFLKRIRRFLQFTFCFFLTFSHRETLFFDKFFVFSTLQKIQKWKIFRFFIFFEWVKYIKIYILFEKRAEILVNFFFYDSLFHKFR